jgi:hypothetical protein
LENIAGDSLKRVRKKWMRQILALHEVLYNVDALNSP